MIVVLLRTLSRSKATTCSGRGIFGRENNPDEKIAGPAESRCFSVLSVMFVFPDYLDSAASGKICFEFLVFFESRSNPCGLPRKLKFLPLPMRSFGFVCC